MLLLTQLQQLLLGLLSVVQGLLKDPVGEAAGDGWRVTVHRLSVPESSAGVEMYISRTVVESHL